MDTVKYGVLAALRSVIDPEVGLDLVALGLIYGLDVGGDEIRVAMTLTSRGCPLGETITGMARDCLENVAGERRVALTLVWEPPWSPRMITPEGRESLRP